MWVVLVIVGMIIAAVVLMLAGIYLMFGAPITLISSGLFLFCGAVALRSGLTANG